MKQVQISIYECKKMGTQTLPECPDVFFTLQELASEAGKIPNVVECTNRSGLYEKLERLQEKYVECCLNLLRWLRIHTYRVVKGGIDHVPQKVHGPRIYN